MKNKIHTLSHLFLFLNLTIALLGMRLPDILGLPMLRFFIYFLFAFGFLVSLVSCLKLKPVLTIGLCLFSASIFFHALVIFFLPSFSPGIAFQDYVLQDNFSSYFAISQTRLYMMYPVLFLFPVLSLYLEGFNSDYKHLYAKTLIIIFVSCMSINNVVVLIQGLWKLNFLAQGSMASVGANRAPGLFLDSGESGFIYSLMTAFIFIYLPKNMEYLKQNKFLVFFFIISSIIAGKFVNNRVFCMNFLFFIFTFCVIKFYFISISMIKKSRFLFGGFSVLFILFISSLWNFFHRDFMLNKVLSYFQVFFNQEGDFFAKYDLIDSVRAEHLKTLWAATKEHFFTGTGLGSFQENLYFYAGRFLKPGQQLSLDLPTNLYLQLVSELGFVGLGLLIFCFIFITRKIIFCLKNIRKIEGPEQDIFILHYFFPAVFIIPLLCSFFVGFNLLYPAVAIIVVFCVVSHDKKFLQYLNVFSYIASFCLILVSLSFLTSIPRVPAFRWMENGKPQMPQDVGNLPQPQGKQESHKIYFAELLQKFFHKQTVASSYEELKGGQWLKFNNELLFFTPNIRIYVPPEGNFPYNLYINYVDANNNVIFSDIRVVNHSGWINIQTNNNIPNIEYCYHHVNMKHFCSYKIEVDKNFYSNKIFYLEEKFSHLPADIFNPN